MKMMWRPPYKYRFLHYVDAYINENDVAAARYKYVAAAR